MIPPAKLDELSQRSIVLVGELICQWCHEQSLKKLLPCASNDQLRLCFNCYQLERKHGRLLPLSEIKVGRPSPRKQRGVNQACTQIYTML